METTRVLDSGVEGGVVDGLLELQRRRSRCGRAHA